MPLTAPGGHAHNCELVVGFALNRRMEIAVFQWLFGKKAKIASSSPGPRERQLGSSPRTKIVDTGDGWISIPPIDFHGRYERSPNGEFGIAWRDNGPGGGHGDYALIRSTSILCHGTMERPQDGKTANNGVFILNDWRDSTELKGTFRAFRPDGTPLMVQDFAANLLNNGLSTDGRLAACHTCNSNDDTDSAVLALFDLSQGKEIHRFRPESGWPNSYAFSPNGDTVTLGYPNGEGQFAYNLDGTFLDRAAWIEAGLNRGNLPMIRRVFDEAGGKPTMEDASRLMAALDYGLTCKNWQDGGWQAFGFRLRGEIQESQGEVSAAIASYTKALALNPKIGAKRRADRLLKNLQQPNLKSD